MKITLSRAKSCGEPKNCSYPIKCEVGTAAEFLAAVAYDHVCGKFRNNYRDNKNFEECDCVVMDCDNDHSDNPDDWITPESYENIFPGVDYIVVPSRNNMKPKGGKSARPRHHVYFPCGRITSAEDCTALKRRIYETKPEFDGKALDAARFIFGNKTDEVLWHEGGTTIDEFLNTRSAVSDADAAADFEAFDEDSEKIKEGSRNSTMSHIAGKLVKRYGNTEEAHNIFLEKAALCSSPLSDSELSLIWNSAVKFGGRVSAEDGYIPPEQFNKLNSLRPDDYSDIGQGKALAQEYKDKMVYTDASDYMMYDGKRWVESKQLAIGAAENFLDYQLEDVQNAVEHSKNALLKCGVSKDILTQGGKALSKVIDSRSEKAFAAYCAAMTYLAFVMKRRDMKYVLSALQAAKPMLLRQISEFDSNEFLLNTPAATYDLRYGIVGDSKHSAADCITKITAVSPDTKNADLWENAVKQFFCDDEKLIEYVQQIVGLAAVGKVYVEALIIAYGEGSNGKSTFWNTIARVLGTYSGTISADALTVGCKRNVKPEMAELKGKRLVIAAELEEGMRLNTSTVKQLCSTDEISAEKKYKDPFKYTPTHTLILYTNHLPRVGANDDGTWRRLIVIPFNAKIEGASDIKNYADYLVENAGGAVLTWIIEGSQKAIAAGFKIPVPQCVVDAVERYRQNNDWLSIFIEDCCEVDPSFIQKSGEFYQEYRACCARTGEYARSTTDFYTGLEIAGFERRRTKTANVVVGIRLKSEFMD